MVNEENHPNYWVINIMRSHITVKIEIVINPSPQQLHLRRGVLIADFAEGVVVEAVHYRAGVGEDDFRATVNVRDDVVGVRVVLVAEELGFAPVVAFPAVVEIAETLCAVVVERALAAVGVISAQATKHVEIETEFVAIGLSYHVQDAIDVVAEFGDVAVHLARGEQARAVVGENSLLACGVLVVAHQPVQRVEFHVVVLAAAVGVVNPR